MYPSIQWIPGLEIPTYFLVISLVVSVSLLWVTRRADIYGLSKKTVLDLSLLLMISATAGARLMHILYENLDYYQEHPLRIFFLWEGGFVYYGGFIAAMIAVFFYFKITRPAKVGLYFDTFAPVAAFAYGFGRIGCFLAGCCYGAACDYPWAVAGKHPAQVYALLWEIGCILLLLGLEKKDPRQRPAFLKKPGSLFLLWVALHAIGRLLMESVRDDFRGDLILGLSVSSLISWLLLATATLLLSRPLFRKVGGLS